MNNALVVYDSVFGNTKLIAKAIADALSQGMNVQLLSVGDVTTENLKNLKLLLVGSPTRSFMATPACMTWIKSISPGVLKGVNAAAFDTRIPDEQLKSNKFLNFFSFLIAYAADKISKALTKKKVLRLSQTLQVFMLWICKVLWLMENVSVPQSGLKNIWVKLAFST